MKSFLKYLWFLHTSTRLYKYTEVSFIKISSVLGFDVSLSQFGEDLIIKSLIKREAGFFVDFGCNRSILKTIHFCYILKGTEV
jgi:hypothetical protein